MSDSKGFIDNPFYSHAPLPGRKPFFVSGNARVAFCVFLYLEYYELDPPQNTLRDPRFSDGPGYFFPDYRTYSLREYGNRVGIFRILDLLDRYGIRATVAANAEACRRYPFLVRTFLNRDYEFAGHGQFATRMISSRMSESEERRHIRESLEALREHTGVKPRGWIGQDYGESHRSPQLLAQSGLQYLVDWSNDDQPYRMHTEPLMISVPAQEQWDDVQMIWHRHVSTRVYLDSLTRAFDVLWDEGLTSTRVFGLHLHPWVVGAPQRIWALERILAYVAQRQGVWPCRAFELVDQYCEASTSSST